MWYAQVWCWIRWITIVPIKTIIPFWGNANIYFKTLPISPNYHIVDRHIPSCSHLHPTFPFPLFLGWPIFFKSQPLIVRFPSIFVHLFGHVGVPFCSPFFSYPKQKIGQPFFSLVMLGSHLFHRFFRIPKKGPNFSLSQSPVFQKPRHQVFREVWQKVRPGVGWRMVCGWLSPVIQSRWSVLDGDLEIPHDPPFSSIAPIKYDINAIQNRFWIFLDDESNLNMMNIIYSILFLGRLSPGSTSLKLLAKDHPGCSL